MCRILAYAGEPIALDQLLYAPAHSLERQAHAPRHQTLGRINADGWGVAWYDPAVGTAPARYRTATPMWADNRFKDIASFIRSAHAVAAVRNASPGAPVEETGNSPFVADQYAFTHNGFVTGFREGLGVQLRRGLSERRDAQVLGAADSEVLFAMVLDLLDKGASLTDAVRDVIAELLSVAEGKLNLILSDGTTIVATREGNSLFTRSRPTGHVVASEPFDDDADWIEVPDHSLVVLTATTITTEAL